MCPPPREPKGGHTRLCVRSEKKRRLEKKVCTLPTLCFLTSRRKEEVIAFISFSTYLLQDSGISLVHPPRGLLEAVGGGGEARNRVGMGLSHRPAGLPVHRLAESIPGLHKILKMPSQSRTVCSAGGGVQCTVYYHYSEPTKLFNTLRRGGGTSNTVNITCRNVLLNEEILRVPSMSLILLHCNWSA